MDDDDDDSASGSDNDAIALDRRDDAFDNTSDPSTLFSSSSSFVYLVNDCRYLGSARSRTSGSVTGEFVDDDASDDDAGLLNLINVSID